MVQNLNNTPQTPIPAANPEYNEPLEVSVKPKEQKPFFSVKRQQALQKTVLTTGKVVLVAAALLAFVVSPVTAIIGALLGMHTVMLLSSERGHQLLNNLYEQTPSLKSPETQNLFMGIAGVFGFIAAPCLTLGFTAGVIASKYYSNNLSH